MQTAILLSGGLDSIALAHWQKPDLAITIDYGQTPAEGEIRAAAVACSQMSIRHTILRIDCSSLGSGDLAGRPPLAVAPVSEWWPFRNQLLVTLGATRALQEGAKRLLIGTVASDQVHKDGTAEFVESASRLLAVQEGELSLEAPALALTSLELVATSKAPIGLLAWSHSCHMANLACGTCRGCFKHNDVMERLIHSDGP